MAVTAVHDHVAAARALAARLPQLIDESRRTAISLRSGLHGNRKVGPGSDFWQFRPYVPGDPTNQIDWRRSARSDHTFIRQTEWQASHNYWIWPVLSPSMYWSSSDKVPSKAERTLIISIALADLLIRNGETVGTFDGERTRITSAEHLEKLAHAMLATPHSIAEQGGTIHAGRKHSILLLGDFLEFSDQGEKAGNVIRRLGQYQNDGALVQILDPAEISPPFRGRINLFDTEDQMIYRSERFEDIADGFRQRAQKWRASVRDAARHNDWLYDRHVTSESASPTLLALYQHLSERQNQSGSNGRGRPTLHRHNQQETS
ncbi:DUF58 domain-containing protein [uncultured Thalassospira sp.]|uniref:DUF58 domain-containing protein n=1 Tax=uncultured Thalassospira sp. TaxID=404382 RepID=UPI002584C137|nr:DUF58 domain-containing protein [uncultured Thalassospira sp.]